MNGIPALHAGQGAGFLVCKLEKYEWHVHSSPEGGRWESMGGRDPLPRGHGGSQMSARVRTASFRVWALPGSPRRRWLSVAGNPLLSGQFLGGGSGGHGNLGSKGRAARCRREVVGAASTPFGRAVGPLPFSAGGRARGASSPRQGHPLPPVHAMGVPGRAPLPPALPPGCHGNPPPGSGPEPRARAARAPSPGPAPRSPLVLGEPLRGAWVPAAKPRPRGERGSPPPLSLQSPPLAAGEARVPPAR